MPFQFVDNATIDRKARKLIRSHAAKGRNVGKMHSRGRKHASQRVKTIALIYPTKAIEHVKGEESEEPISRIGQPIGDGLSVLSIPVELTPRSKVLVHKVFSFISGALYRPEISNTIDFAEASSMWIQYIFLDDAYFHCSVAMWVAAVNPLFVKQEDTIESMRHLSEAFRLVNEKLSGKEAVSDTTMAVVVAMTQYERLQTQYCQGLVHFEGLLRMVQLRGGISELLRVKPALAQKIFRADLEFALHLGSPTRFIPADLPGHDTICWLRSRFRQDHQAQFCHTRVLRQLDPEVHQVLMDIACLAWLLNNGPKHGLKLTGYIFHDILILIGYRLNHLSPLCGSRPVNYLEAALQLGLMSFMTTFMVGLGQKIPQFLILCGLARSAAQGHFDEDEESQRVLLWILFIGRASIFGELDDVWLIPRMLKTALVLGLHSWEDVRRTLIKLPWLSSIHDKAGQALWESSKSSPETLDESHTYLSASAIDSS